MKTTLKQRWMRAAVCGLSLAGVIGSTGCQSYMGGQTLPSPWYIGDDVQYHAPGPEFKLSNEAAALKAAKAQQMQNQ